MQDRCAPPSLTFRETMMQQGWFDMWHELPAELWLQVPGCHGNARSRVLVASERELSPNHVVTVIPVCSELHQVKSYTAPLYPLCVFSTIIYAQKGDGLSMYFLAIQPTHVYPTLTMSLDVRSHKRRNTNHRPGFPVPPVPKAGPRLLDDTTSALAAFLPRPRALAAPTRGE
jgi:hypothetical protein